MENFYKKWKIVGSICAMILINNAVFAQQTVSGTVVDAGDGTGIPGVNIVIKGTTTGTITDFNGEYSLNVPDDATLVFSYVGYENKEVPVGSQSVIDVEMAPDVQALAEVVVVGYGTQRKEDVTGVVASVNNEDFNRGAIVSPDNLIAGKVAGVQVTSNNGGEPGGQTSIRIRGGTSINASNEPLYVIDGVPIDNSPHDPGGFQKGRNPLNFLNPDDIETITVLKDASAAAIYGSRAANGVIIINTKSGKQGQKPTISYNNWISFAQAIDDVDVLNAGQFRNIVEEVAPFRTELLLNANTDWQNQLFETAFGQNHTVSLSGGAEDVNYRMSVGFLDQEGIMKGAETERVSFNLNYNHSLLDDQLSMNLSVKGSSTNDVFIDNGAIGAAVAFAPTQPIRDANNPFGGFWEWPLSFGNAVVINPVSMIEQPQDIGSTFRSVGNLQMEYKIPFLEGLSVKTNLGYDVTRGERKKFIPFTLRSQATDSGEVRNENITRVSNLLDVYVNYKKELSAINSNIDFTGGYSFQDFENEFPSFRAFTLSTNIFGIDNPTVASQFEVNNSVPKNRLISGFGRLTYSFHNRYILTVTLRRDGSSRFGPEEKWGTFPSAAIAWRIIDEDFMGSSDFLDDLKLRFGWGVTGNQEIGDFNFLTTFRPGDQFTRVQFGNDFVTTIRPSGADPGLKWEETESFNVGIDYGFFQGRITGSVEYYLKQTDDLLFTVTVPAGTNLTNRILTNIGEIENEGVELAVNGIAFDEDDLRLDVGFNFAYNQNEITNLAGADEPGFQGFETGGISGGVGNNIQILNVGQPVNSFLVFKHIIGPDGRPLVDDVDHNEDGAIDLADIYVDTNGDGIVNDNDKRPFEKPAPDWIFGLTSQAYYQNFDLNFTLRANLGNYVYNNVSSAAGFKNLVNGIVPGNMHTSVLETDFFDAQFFSDFYLEDGSFLRLDNITVGYTLPEMPGDLNLRIYWTGQNLLTVTGYDGLDPEIQNGIDNNIFPRTRTYIAGLSFQF